MGSSGINDSKATVSVLYCDTYTTFIPPASHPSAEMPQKLTLHHMWGGCPHVTDITGNIEPATMQPATVTLHQAKLVPARSNGFTVIYKNALFPDRTEEQEFVPGSGSGYNNAAKGNFSG